MSTPPIIDSPRRQPTRLVFHGVFCLWAKPRLPPDVVSANPATLNPSDSGSGAVVVPNSPAAGGLTSNLARSEVRHGYLRRWRSLGGIRQRAILLPLVGPAFVVVPAVVSQGTFQTSATDEPAPPDAFALHRAHPALGDGIEIGAARRNRDRLDATAGLHFLPPTTELGVTVVDEVLGTDLGRPADFDNGVIARRLSHEVSVGVLSDTGDVDAPAAVVDGEQHIVGAFSLPTPDVDGEEVGGDHGVEVLGEEVLPGRVRSALRCRPESMATHNRGDGSRSEDDSQLQQFSADAHLSPGGVLLGQADDRLLGLSGNHWSPRSCPLQAQLPSDHQAMLAANGGRLGYAGDLGQTLPADIGSGPGELLPPRVGEAQGAFLGDLFKQEANLGAQVGNLGYERFVLLTQDGCGNESNEKSQAGHGATQSSAWWNSFKRAKFAA